MVILGAEECESENLFIMIIFLFFKEADFFIRCERFLYGKLSIWSIWVKNIFPSLLFSQKWFKIRTSIQNTVCQNFFHSFFQKSQRISLVSH